MRIATRIPVKYKPVITNHPCSGKKAWVKKAYTGILAEQLMKGVKRTVIFRSRSEGRVRVAITAGTVQPKPMSIGTKLLPESPSFLKSLSMMKATLAI